MQTLRSCLSRVPGHMGADLGKEVAGFGKSHSGDESASDGRSRARGCTPASGASRDPNADGDIVPVFLPEGHIRIRSDFELAINRRVLIEHECH
jgi:hypothetical protein